MDFAVRSVDTFPDANKNYRPDKDEKKSTYNLVAAVSHRARPSHSRNRAEERRQKDDKKKKDAGDETEMRVRHRRCHALTDVVMANVVGNQLLFADAVRWLGVKRASREVNTEEDVRIEHTKQKDLAWFCATTSEHPRWCWAWPGVRRTPRKGRSQVITWRSLSGHWVALGVASALALFVWTRKAASSTQKATWKWGGSAERVESMRFEAENRSVRLDKRKDSQGLWFVGSVEKTTEVKPLPARDGGLRTPLRATQPARREEGEYQLRQRGAGKKLAEPGPAPGDPPARSHRKTRAAEFGFDKAEARSMSWWPAARTAHLRWLHRRVGSLREGRDRRGLCHQRQHRSEHAVRRVALVERNLHLRS